MKYKISHITKYEYAENVPVCQNQVYLTPRNTPFQSCIRNRLTISPHPASSHKRIDYFGNTATMFSIDKVHRILQITASSTVDVSAHQVSSSSPAWESIRDALPLRRTSEGLADYQFTFRSPHVPFYRPTVEYAKSSFASERPILEAIADLNGRLFHDFEYDSKATSVTSGIMEVFEIKRGVCQDLAHIMLACLRPYGIAARYVSGYLRTHPPEGQPRLVGAGASHAWVSVFCGDIGWVDFDPTNNSFSSDEHITIAWGRDYSDVCPAAGMFVGGGDHALTVSVDVQPA